MNDPHVEALHYTIQHGDHIDMSKAAGVEHEFPNFALKAADRLLSVTMKAHFASVDEAREAVEPLLRTWELDSALRYGPHAFKFTYDHADVIDRNPSPGVRTAVIEPVRMFARGGTIKMVIGLAHYPSPPSDMSRDRIVDHMFTDYLRYRNGGTKLGNAAHYCLTWLEEGAKPYRRGNQNLRNAASERYMVAMAVLSKLGHLADAKGGLEGRKAHAAMHDYTSREKQWLETVMTVLIRRAAEVAFDPNASRPEITMADLPSLAEKK